MPDRIFPAIAMRLASAFLLSAMFALAKLAQKHGVNVIELLFWRQAIMVIPAVAIAAMTSGLATLRSAAPWGQVRRAAVGLTGMSMNFAVVGMLPLAEVQTIWFTVPMFATILGALWLGERVGIHRWSAVIVGFLGVLIVFQPGHIALPATGLALALASSGTMAVIAVLVRQIGAVDSSLTTVAWFGGLSAIILLVPTIMVGQAHTMTAWIILIATGLIGGLGQIAMTYSYRFAPVSVLMPMDYSSLIWAAFFGWWLFGDLPSHWIWVGAPILIGSGLYIVWRERVRAQRNVDGTSAA